MTKYMTWLLLSLSFGPLFGMTDKEEEELTKKSRPIQQTSSKELQKQALPKDETLTHKAELEDYIPEKEYFTASSLPRGHVDLRQKKLKGKIEAKKGNYTFSTNYNLKQGPSGRPEGDISTSIKWSW